MNIPLNRFEEWLMSKNLKEKTIKSYLYYLGKFTYPAFNQETMLKFLVQKSNRNRVARAFLLNFKKFLISNHKEFNFSIEQLTDINEVELPKLTGREKIRLVHPLLEEEIKLIENCLATEKLKIQLLLSYYCGLRLGELMKIQIISFNWDSWKQDTSKYGECRVYGKGDKEGIALVPPFLMIRIAKFIKSNNYESINSRLFMANGKVNIENKARMWQYELRKAGIKAGLTQFDDENSPIHETVVHPHRLRHSYASYLLNVKKMNLREVQELLRHSSIQSTQIYTYTDKENLKEKLNN